jgi:thymidylate kinase
MTLSPSERLAAFLIAPDAARAPGPKEMPDPDSFLELVELHKLPIEEIIAVNGLGGHEVVKSECVQHALRADAERHREHLERFVAFRERLDAENIPHVLVKGVWGFPYRSENVDLMIPAESVGRADEILTEMGYVYNSFRPERFKRLHVLTAGSQWVITIHLHTAVGWYSLFVEPEMILDSAVDGSEAGVRIPRCEVAMAINGVHALYEDATVRLIELYKIRHLVRSGPIDWDWLWKFASHRGFESGLSLVFLILDRQHRTLTGKPLFEEALLRRMESCLSRVDGTRQHYRRHVAGRDLSTYYTLSKYFVRRCLFRQVKRCRLTGPWGKMKAAARILYGGFFQVTRWQPQPPALIAICGPDGCGKTTQIERVSKVLEVFEIYSRRSWIRIGDSPLLNWLKVPFRRRVRAEVEAGQLSEQGVFQSRVVRTLWPVVALADYVIRQYLAFAWISLRGKMVIADRYHVDALVDLALRCGPEIMRKHWVVSVLRLLPKARPAVVLKVSDETMRRRRAEDYIEGISHRVGDYYDEAAQILGARVLSGEGEPEEIAERIAKESLVRFFELV